MFCRYVTRRLLSSISSADGPVKVGDQVTVLFQALMSDGLPVSNLEPDAALCPYPLTFTVGERFPKLSEMCTGTYSRLISQISIIKLLSGMKLFQSKDQFVDMGNEMRMLTYDSIAPVKAEDEFEPYRTSFETGLGECAVQVKEFDVAKMMQLSPEEEAEMEEMMKGINDMMATMYISSIDKIKVICISSLTCTTISPGDGKTFPKLGDHVTIHYIGRLSSNNALIDSAQAFKFTVGVGQSQILKGWDLSVMKMSLGETARVVIPSEQAYGKKGDIGIVPPDAEVIFDIELIQIN